jgi:hypothetical protein
MKLLVALSNFVAGLVCAGHGLLIAYAAIRDGDRLTPHFEVTLLLALGVLLFTVAGAYLEKREHEA